MTVIKVGKKSDFPKSLPSLETNLMLLLPDPRGAGTALCPLHPKYSTAYPRWVDKF